MELKYCKKCVMPSTRPRIVFDKDGVCSACRFQKRKKTIDWNARKKELQKICNKFRSKDGSFDVIVPVGGGKDSSYVAWQLKHEMGMHPLCVSAKPPLSTLIGKKNLENFAESGFTVMEVTPNPIVGRKIAKQGLIKYGQPQTDWLFAMFAIPLKIAVKLNIPFVMYGEEGESEYGGTKDLENKPDFNMTHVKKFYYSGINAKELAGEDADEADLYWYTPPSENEVNTLGLFATHWSFFEYWNEYDHIDFAIKHCGLESKDKSVKNDYNNASHTDQLVYDLHMYIAWLKFGFGRVSTLQSIDIRYGKTTRKEAIKIVNRDEGKFPKEHLQLYLEYFDMNEDELFAAIEKFRNKDIWEKVNGEWKLKTELK